MFDPKDELTITQDGKLLLEKAKNDQVQTVWDRHEDQQPHCGYCETGLSCRICIMGPCRIDPFGTTGPKFGICGASADVIVARGLARNIAVRQSLDSRRAFASRGRAVASNHRHGTRCRDG